MIVEGHNLLDQKLYKRRKFKDYYSFLYFPHFIHKTNARCALTIAVSYYVEY